MRGSILPAVQAAGGELIVIGSGTLVQAREFAGNVAKGLRVLTDPELVSFRAAGLQRSVLRTLSPRSAGNVLRAFRGGHRQKGVAGDPWQQGGTLVLGPHGVVRYHHVSKVMADHAPVREVLAAVGPAMSMTPISRIGVLGSLK